MWGEGVDMFNYFSTICFHHLLGFIHTLLGSVLQVIHFGINLGGQSNSVANDEQSTSIANSPTRCGGS